VFIAASDIFGRRAGTGFTVTAIFERFNFFSQFKNQFFCNYSAALIFQLFLRLLLFFCRNKVRIENKKAVFTHRFFITSIEFSLIYANA
jgi:hypothetical protein